MVRIIHTRSVWMCCLLFLVLPNSLGYQAGTVSATTSSYVLVTGFEPFDIYEVNPSELVAEALNGTVIHNATIVSLILPVDFNESVAMVTQAIDVYKPVLVISLGLSPRATGIEVEQCAWNIKRYQKENGHWSFPQRLDPTSPLVFFSSLPVRTIVNELHTATISGHMSFFAGTYVCNAVFFGELHYSETHHLSTTVGFLHVPLLDSQDPQGMELSDMIDAVEITIESSLE